MNGHAEPTFPPRTGRAWWSGAAPSERRQLIAAGALGALATLASPALLALSGYLLARAAEAPPILTLTAAIVGVRLFALVRATGRYAERLVSHDLALRRLGRDRVAVFSRLVPAIPGRTGMRSSTDVLDRLVADTDRLQDLTVRVVVPAVAIATTVVVAVAVTAALAPVAAPILTAAVAVQVGALVAIERRSGARLASRQAAARERLTRDLVTVLDAGAELVAWGAADRHAARVARRGSCMDGLVRRAAAAASTGGAVSVAVAGVATLAVLLVASYDSAGGHLRPALVPALALLALGTVDAAAGASELLTARSDVSVAADRIAATLPDEAAAATGFAPPDDATLTVRNLRIVRDGRALLDGVDLDVAPAERVALMGPSGAGKSTLGAVVAGLVPPDGGVARVGGVDVEVIDEDRRHELVCWVPQDPHIFPTTLGANLRIAAPSATDAELEAALRAVGGGAWLDRLPKALGTPLGERGERCSGGERQRVGLARAVLARSPLVVLDEPASHLPSDEAVVALQAVMGAQRGRSTLLVTHRAEEANLADRVVTLTAGRT